MAVQYNIRKPAFDSLVAVDTGSDETSVPLFDAAMWLWHAKLFVQVPDTVRQKIVNKIQRELDEFLADPNFAPECAEVAAEHEAAPEKSASASGAKAGEGNAGQGSPRDQDNDGRTTPATPLPGGSPVKGSVVQRRRTSASVTGANAAEVSARDSDKDTGSGPSPVESPVKGVGVRRKRKAAVRTGGSAAGASPKKSRKV